MAGEITTFYPNSSTGTSTLNMGASNAGASNTGMSGAQGSGYASAIGSVLQLGGQIYSAYLQKSISKYNKRVAEAQAALVEQNIKMRTYRAKYEMNAIQGKQIAGYAKSGVRLSGSPIDVIQESRFNAELNLEMANINDRLTAAGYRVEGQLYSAQGNEAMARGYSKAANTLLDMGSTLYSNRRANTTQTIGGTSAQGSY